MEGFKELRLKIDVGMKPSAFPFARLAEYLADFAALVGHKENVHLMEIEDGSTMPMVFIKEDLEPQAVERIRQAKFQVGPQDANKAYRNIDERLEKDAGVGSVLNHRKENLILFPGNTREKIAVIGPFKEPAFIDGEIERVGGKDDTIPVWVKGSDGQIFHCETGSKSIAKELAQHMYEPMRVLGTATRMRDDKGVWNLQKFSISGVEELSNASLLDVVATLRSIDGGWGEDKDHLYTSVKRMRNGEEI